MVQCNAELVGNDCVGGVADRQVEQPQESTGLWRIIDRFRQLRRPQLCGQFAFDEAITERRLAFQGDKETFNCIDRFRKCLPRHCRETGKMKTGTGVGKDLFWGQTCSRKGLTADRSDLLGPTAP